MCGMSSVNLVQAATPTPQPIPTQRSYTASDLLTRMAPRSFTVTNIDGLGPSETGQIAAGLGADSVSWYLTILDIVRYAGGIPFILFVAFMVFVPFWIIKKMRQLSVDSTPRALEQSKKELRKEFKSHEKFLR